MEVGEFFNLLFGEKGTEPAQPEPAQPEPAQLEPTQTEPTQTEPTEPKTTGASEVDMRSLIREELKSMMSDAMQKKEEAQKAARAASSIQVPEENKRTIEDILAERYIAAMGGKQKEGK